MRKGVKIELYKSKTFITNNDGPIYKSRTIPSY
jgi:hypothetical protein